MAKVERADDGAGDVYEESSRGPQRSRAGCLVCRERKVKCDEVRPVCGKCAIKSRQVSVSPLHLLRRVAVVSLGRVECQVLEYGASGCGLSELIKLVRMARPRSERQ